MVWGFSHCPRKHHWLQEGFATYYAALAEREYMEMIISILNYTKQRSKLNMLLERISGSQWKASSLSFLSKGAWALFALREAIGDQAFKKAVSTWINTLFKVWKRKISLMKSIMYLILILLNSVKCGLSLRYLIPLHELLNKTQLQSYC
jgi:hypothetical protein